MAWFKRTDTELDPSGEKPLTRLYQETTGEPVDWPALVYARRWPDPLPRVFGFHEVFHLLVVAGAATFAATIWVWIVPFPRA